ncbi:MAG: MBL fold metallo-hydrolase [Firmicutes bacterium]|nr:MBL fold metallo-hydrolase [Bacillota bacterium]
MLPGHNLELEGALIEVVPAYNIGKQFHPKDNSWVGYIVTIDDERIYVAGDTDNNEDIRKVVCDVAMVPIGGTYTMTADEAAGLVNAIKPKVAIPTHYNAIVGSKEDEETFIKAVDEDIEVIIKL